jgi:hypothetical protein
MAQACWDGFKVAFMRTILIATMVCVSLVWVRAAAAQSTAPVAPVKETVWYWSQSCSENRALKLEVSLHGKLIFRSSFPICSMARTDQAQKTLVFRFKGGQIYQGEYHTSPTDVIEGNIWQAGADPDALILGVSFMTKRQVLLNTLHIAKPGRYSTTEVDRGIVVRTFPIGDDTKR